MKPKKLIRILISLQDSLDKGFDSMIGKKAHIEIIANNKFLNFVINNYPFLFE